MNEDMEAHLTSVAVETGQLHIVWLMYLNVYLDLQRWAGEENEELWGLALPFSQTNVSSALSVKNTHTHALDTIRLFLDPQTLTH